MSAKTRVQKFRESLRRHNCGRLEVWIDATLIDQVREMARFQSVPVWSAVQDALEAHPAEWRKVLAEGQRLSDERARVLKLAGVSGYGPQIMEYNRQLAAYNARLASFQGSAHSD